MKVQAKVEKKLFRLIDRKDKLKNGMTLSTISMNAERINVLE